MKKRWNNDVRDYLRPFRSKRGLSKSLKIKILRAYLGEGGPAKNLIKNNQQKEHYGKN
ncbi:MAG: hypothetical protein WCG27_08455 [Pseudomonadota bacterium]